MLGMHPYAAVFGALPDLGDQPTMRTYARYLTRDLSMAVLLCRPGTKEPLDLRTTAQRTEDTAAGRTGSGVHTATTDLARLRSYMKAAEKAAAPARARLGVLTARRDIAMLSDPTTADAAADALGQGRINDLAARYEEAWATVAVAETGTPPRQGTKASAALAVARTIAECRPLTPHEERELSRLIATTPAEGEPLYNLAVVPGRSALIVVDCDTAEEVAAFQRWAAELSGDPNWLRTAPTVDSPGVYDPEAGQWLHRYGGHFYFRVPSAYTMPLDHLPDSVEVDYGGAHFSVIVGTGRYVLLPPSQRKEGAYRAHGPSHDAPGWMLRAMTEEAVRRRDAKAARAAARAAGEEMDEDAAEALQDWYDATPWMTIFRNAGWSATGTDRCGCPVFRRPGGASWKSVTAHEPGCELHCGSDDPPAHFWSTEVPWELTEMMEATATGSRSLSKLQVVAALFYDGDISNAWAGCVGGGSGITYGNVRMLAPGFGVVDVLA